MAGTTDIIISYDLDASVSTIRSNGGEHDYSADTKLGRGATRLEVAHRLFLALMAQDPDRLITLRDGSGQVVARHDPRPEQG